MSDSALRRLAWVIFHGKHRGAWPWAWCWSGLRAASMRPTASVKAASTSCSTILFLAVVLDVPGGGGWRSPRAVPRNPIGWLLLAIGMGWGTLLDLRRIRRLRAEAASRLAARRRDRGLPGSFLDMGSSGGGSPDVSAVGLPTTGPPAEPTVEMGRIPVRRSGRGYCVLTSVLMPGPMGRRRLLEPPESVRL